MIAKILLLLLSSSPSFDAKRCTPLTSTETFVLCSQKSKEESLSPFPTFDVFALRHSDKQAFFISHELNLKEVASLVRISDRSYYYRAFLGGNSVNAENRHVLIYLHDDGIKNAGEFSGYADINGNGIKEFYTYAVKDFNNARASASYIKQKLSVKSGQLLKK